jgi:sugar/nucleoside kinase (ribokinase family)
MADEADFDGCHRTCRAKGVHSLIWGGCEHATPPEPTVSMSVVYRDHDGQNSIGFDLYTAQQLADLIEPALRRVTVRLGPNALAMLQRGETVVLSGGEYADLAREAAHAIVHRNGEGGSQ